MRSAHTHIKRAPIIIVIIIVIVIVVVTCTAKGSFGSSASRASPSARHATFSCLINVIWSRAAPKWPFASSSAAVRACVSSDVMMASGSGRGARARSCIVVAAAAASGGCCVTRWAWRVSE